MTATMTFDDEFNSLSISTISSGGGGTWQPTWSPTGYDTPDSDGWLTNPLYGPTSAADADPFSIDNGVLNISVIPTPADVNAAAVGYQPYISGQLLTHDSFSQEYGYFEMGAEMPSNPGINAGFWMVSASGVWPPELDIEEVLSRQPLLVYTSLWSAQTGSAQVSQQQSVVSNTSQSFHTYAMDWDPNTITYYIDNKEVYQIATPADAHQPMYMIIGESPGNADSWQGQYTPVAGDSSTMQVDYVRAWNENPYTNGGATETQYSTPTPTPSANDTVVTAGSSGEIVDSSGNIWQISASDNVTENELVAGQNANVAEIAYVNSTIWHENTSGQWFSWANGTWTLGSDPLGAGGGSATSTQTSGAAPTPTPTPSANNTVALAGSPDGIVDASGNSWTISASDTVLENGAMAGFTANVAEIAYAGGQIWHENTSDQWFSWASNAWTLGSNPTTSSGDTIFAGLGANQTLTGGSGANVFVYDGSGYTDAIANFNPATDTIDFENLGAQAGQTVSINDFSGGSTVSFDGNVITLNGVLGSSLSDTNFQFPAGSNISLAHDS